MNIFGKKKETDAVQLGKYPVEVAKLTPAKWKQLFLALDKIPSLILQVISAPKTAFYPYLVNAIDIGLDEIVEITALLSGVEAEYIREEVGTDEIIEYLTLTVKKNRLDSQAKNVKSLLPKLEK
ncbi:hypothetical protein BUN12_0139 [Bacillus amyloliquefaciens]|jgi:hypothetical protein|uniref:Uncharacterized protein n=1 Tax=Bacillus amyloliquefaciens (strain ATCC 23350 / DSM 7 / BCRC 11601 / CCUG 28519 / NBRC 15535 / NRRL B-14393 / F) TaxID=692420 RepID=A0A9P1JF74_BACAS|nr:MULTISPECIES: hypothetical protein [Bacillus amyloliquefaciens group]AZV88403.1 hypothetical protein BUN12_0139 [Bacillus amyloliquefaciens]MDR4375237.1 hypothetical protein [Bacillus amyloliquefaciens]MEC1838120.1 hypothetical protein [Bacillus amyloliquefaciens]MEC1846759.1 hypothetical protein [Bacillus amyloliquefaciens]MEC1930452.1 hypothetical protein [Bacillus amyloliquefaciens]